MGTVLVVVRPPRFDIFFQLVSPKHLVGGQEYSNLLTHENQGLEGYYFFGVLWTRLFETLSSFAISRMLLP